MGSSEGSHSIISLKNEQDRSLPVVSEKCIHLHIYIFIFFFGVVVVTVLLPRWLLQVSRPRRHRYTIHTHSRSLQLRSPQHQVD